MIKVELQLAIHSDYKWLWVIICKERTLIFRFIVIGSTTTVGLLDIFFISWLRLSFLGYSIRAIHFNEGTFDSTKGSAASTRLKQQQPTPIFTVLLKLYSFLFSFFFFLLYNCVAVCALYKKIKERKENWVHHQITTTRRCVYTTRRQSKRLENGNKFQNSTIAADRLTFFLFSSIFTVKQRNEEAGNTDLQWVSKFLFMIQML